MKLLRRKAKTDQLSRRPGVQAPRGRGVFSYYANRAPREPSEGREERAVKPRFKKWHYIPSVVAFLAIIISLGYILRLDTNPRISLIDDQHAVAVRSLDTYHQAAQKALGSSWFNHNKLTVNTGDVVHRLKEQFPELDQVVVTLPLIGQRPLVELSAVQPVLVLSSDGKVFVVARNGKAVAAASDASPKLKDLPHVTDASGLGLEAGKTVLPEAEVSFIETLSQQLLAQKLSIESLTLPALPHELDVRLKGLPYFIKFNTAADTKLQVGTFIATKQRLEAGHITPKEYIDVRVEEKAFYK